MSPKFSIIIPHYDGVISDEVLLEGLTSIETSTYKDFEVLLYHDGPESRPTPDLSKFTFPIKYRATKKRYNNWGHSLRDLGIREAKGEYILHFNPDNLLFFNALEDITKVGSDIVICPIVLDGCVVQHNMLYRTGNPAHKVVLPGQPPVKNNIDAMQLVAKRSIWLDYGGWKNKAETSDGNMYPEMADKYGYEYCTTLMGVHR